SDAGFTPCSWNWSPPGRPSDLSEKERKGDRVLFRLCRYLTSDPEAGKETLSALTGGTMKITVGLLGAAIFLGLATLPARAEETKAKAAGKMALAKYQDAVVTVKLILKEKGSKVEMPTEISGTVLSADGLTVMSDFSTNPSGLLAGEGASMETTD